MYYLICKDISYPNKPTLENQPYFLTKSKKQAREKCKEIGNFCSCFEINSNGFVEREIKPYGFDWKD